MRNPDGTPLSRRRLLAAGALTLGIAGLTRPKPVFASTDFTDVPLQPIDFQVMRGGEDIGSHHVQFARRGDRLDVRTQIDIEVKLLGVTLYLYRHESLETWADQRLKAYDSDTTEDDARFVVVGRAIADGFDIRCKSEHAVAPADIMVASYWTPAICAQTLLIEPKRGRLRKQEVLGADPVEVDIGGTIQRATEYRVGGILDGTATYKGTRRWIGARFRKFGSMIVYQPHA